MILRTLLATAALLALTATTALADPSATIRRTALGMPHIVADDWEGLGYGYGYAIAEDNICVLADTYTTVRGERSQYFGPDATWTNRGNSSTQTNLNSDFFYKQIIDEKTVEKLMSQPPPLGPRPEIREAVRGYVAGYNKQLQDRPPDQITDPACKGKPWVHPIEEIDAYRRFYSLALLASQAVAIDGIGGAQPPTPATGMGQQATTQTQTEMLGELKQRLPLGGVGSNAVALGKDATENGKGMLLGNPHFPWKGSERFYQSHVTIPGKIDASGGSLFGVPVILIGHTQNLAWSHTVSTAFRFTPFELKLVPGSPTTYLYDGEPKQMTSRTVTVKALVNGKLEDRTRTLYSTIQGPVLTSILGLPLFPWTPATAFAMGDANAANFRYLNHFFETNLSQSTEEYDATLKRNQGIPWVNSIAADSAGRAYYADISVVPNVSNAKVQACGQNAIGLVAFNLLRLPVLDGSRAACAWDNDQDAAQPGIFGPSHLPSLFRDDYVTNSNDSYWLSNPKQPLEGFATIIGDERTTRALRTRSGLVAVEDQLKKSKFKAQDLMDLVFANRQYPGELWRDELVAMCKENPTLTGSNGPVDVSGACPVLEKWDVRDDLDSRGALLFRRFVTRALAKVGGVANPPASPFRNPFSASDPVNTPNGLNTDSGDVRKALADAVTDLQGANIPLDAPLGDFQYEKRGDEKIPIHGGPGTVGIFNAINVTWDPKAGYPAVPHGSSFVQVVHFNQTACPDTNTILTYSQSTDPTSPYFGDQTKLFSRKEWVKERYCDKDIWADPNLKVTNLGGGARAARLLRTATVRRSGRRIVVRYRVARKADVTVLVHRGKRRVTGVRVRNVPAERQRTRRFTVPRGKSRLTISIRARSRTQSERVTKRLR